MCIFPLQKYLQKVDHKRNETNIKVKGSSWEKKGWGGGETSKYVYKYEDVTLKPVCIAKIC